MIGIRAGQQETVLVHCAQSLLVVQAAKEVRIQTTKPLASSLYS